MDAAALLTRYEALLQAADVACARTSEAALAFVGEAECGPCDGTLVLADVETGDAVPGPAEPAILCELAYVAPFPPVTDVRRHALYELLALLGPDVPLGAFEVELGGRVRHRLSTLLPADGALSDAFLMAPLYECLNVVDEHAAMLEAVLTGDVEPGHVFAEGVLERARASGERLDDETRIQLMTLLDRASARYRATGRDLHLDRLTALLRPLAT